MKTINKKGFTIVELIIGLAILSVLIGTVAVNGYAAYKNSLDQGIREDLHALSQATTMFMVSNDGVAPCFSPENQEGTATATGICANSSYDYLQGSGTGVADTSLDEDNTTGEVFTFNNILVPTYLDKVPLPRRGGQSYIYTKGQTSTAEGASSFAYSGSLAGSKADKIIKDNVSILNVADDTNYANGDVTTACSNTQVHFKGEKAGDANGDVLTIVDSTKNDNTQGFKYYSYANVTNATDGGIVKAGEVCDVYSDGQGILLNNFTNVQGATNGSVSLTVNAK